MTILVTGATGTVGRHVVAQLAQRGAEVRALVRDPARADLPAGIAVVPPGLGPAMEAMQRFSDSMDKEHCATRKNARGDRLSPDPSSGRTK